MTHTHSVNTKSELSAPFGKYTNSGAKSAILPALRKIEPLQERVRARLRRLVDEKGVAHAILGQHLGLTRSAVTRLLNDVGQGIALQHIERLSEFFQVSPAEWMVESGALIQPLSPAEASLVAYFRQLTEVQRMGLLAILDRSVQQPQTRRRSRLGRVELSEEQQLVVDLYARSNEQARSGILKTLRGTAKAGDEERGGTTLKRTIE